MSLLDMLQQQLGPSEVQQISQQIGADPAQTRTAVEAALPMMVGGMASRAQQPGGTDSLVQAFGGLGGTSGSGGGLGGALGGMLGDSSGGNAGGLGGLGGVLGGMLGGGAGGGILGSILGGHDRDVEDGVSQASGLNGDQTRKLLMILAPIVLAMLAKRHGQAGGGQLGGALQEEAREAHTRAQQQSPHVGGILGKILAQVQTGH